MQTRLSKFFEYVVNVYDPETKTIMVTYDSENTAARRLGVPLYQVTNCCSKRERIWSPLLNKEIACRGGKRTDEMIFTNGVLEKNRRLTLPS